MPYISSNGEISSRQPWGMSKIVGLFWGVVNLIYAFFRTLISPGSNSRGSSYTQDYRRPGSGPPKPPSKKMGGFGRISSLQPPPCVGSS